MSQTPMMKQYEEIKREHQDSILFYRVGDFYELFHDDAKVAAEKLELTLTTRGKEFGKAIPLAGVPYHSVEPYIGRLVRQGFSVAICDQVEDPKQAKGIVKREVTRVVTPGTVLEESLLDSRSHNYLAALTVRADRFGLAWLDASTADFFAQEFSGNGAEQEMFSELAMIEPREMLLSPDLSDDEQFRSRLRQLLGDEVLLRPCGSEYSLKDSLSFLQREFSVASLEGFGLADFTQGVIAAAEALDYLRMTQRGNPTRMVRIVPRRRSAYMLLDPTTRSNLELTRSMRDGDEQGTLLSVLQRTRTAMGSRMLRDWLHQPLVDRNSIIQRQNAVAAFYQDRILAEDASRILRNVYDLERLVARIGVGTAGGRDLRMLVDSLIHVAEMVDLLSGKPLFSAMVEEIEVFPETVEHLQRALVESPPFTVREGGIIQDGYHPELDELRQIRSGGNQWMAELEEKERERTGIKTLKVKYNKVFGYYLEVTRSKLDLVPEEYIRKQTIAGAERYFTPELKEMENRILGAADRIHQLEYELFCHLREEVNDLAARLLATAKSVARVDVLVSLAVAALENRYVQPEIVEGNDLDIIGGRHPVVERMPGVDFIPNTTTLDGDIRLQIITGPNMAGKSTYIRQVALITLMAQIGSFVPAERAVIGIADRIFTRVGASDNLARGQSTFMVEMVETANILHNASHRSLIILDEIGRGTSTFDGISIAWAIAEFLCKGPRRLRGARTLFATHYHELTRLEGLLPGARNFNVAVVEKNGEILFVRRIVAGGADRSYGIHVGALAGLPRPVIERAHKVLQELERDASRRSFRTATVAEDENQMDLFAAVTEEAMAEPHPILEELQNIDPDSLTPREAHELVYRLKELLKEE